MIPAGKDSGTRVRYGDHVDASAADLPLAVKAWAGMGSRAGEMGPHRRSLAELNDQDHDFAAIADEIERNVDIL